MLLLSKRSVLGIAAVVDIALHARGGPVGAKLLAHRHDLPPRYLEPMLQSLVRAGILKGTRGPRGGYELARERRRVSVSDVVRAVMTGEHEDEPVARRPTLIRDVVEPALHEAGLRFLQSLEDVSIEDLCREADRKSVFVGADEASDFTI